MMEQIFLGFVGLCAGGVVSCGLIGLIIGLSVIPRYAGITHTADKIFWYENATIAGAIAGNLVFLFQWELPVGNVGLGMYGLFSGIYLGSWILALAEMANVFPILVRRMKLQKGLPAAILCIALGKVLGSLYYFYKGW